MPFSVSGFFPQRAGSFLPFPLLYSGADNGRSRTGLIHSSAFPHISFEEAPRNRPAPFHPSRIRERELRAFCVSSPSLHSHIRMPPLPEQPYLKSFCSPEVMPAGIPPPSVLLYPLSAAADSVVFQKMQAFPSALKNRDLLSYFHMPWEKPYPSPRFP